MLFSKTDHVGGLTVVLALSAVIAGTGWREAADRNLAALATERVMLASGIQPLDMATGLTVAPPSASVSAVDERLGRLTGQYGATPWLSRFHGWTSLIEGDDARARVAFEAASDAMSPCWLAVLAAHAGDWDRTARALEQCSTKPVAVLLLQRGELLLLHGQFAEAEPYLEVAVRLDAHPCTALVWRGLLEEQRQRVSSALADFNRIIDECPSSWEGYLYRGGLYLNTGLGTREDAGRDFERAWRLGQGASFPETQWAFWLQDSGRTQEALVQLRRALILTPTDTELYLRLIPLEVDVGDREGARATARVALSRIVGEEPRARVRALMMKLGLTPESE